MKWQVYKDIKPWKKPLHSAIAYLAKIYFQFFLGSQIVGITGSVGKTLTQNATHKVLSQKYAVISGDENLDPTFRIPRTILKARPWHKFIVLEYGVEQPGDMDYYIWIAKPKFALVTNIAATHLKYFKSIDGVFSEKVKLVKALPAIGTAVLNKEDAMVSKMKDSTKANVFWFNENSKLSVEVSDYAQNINGSTFTLHHQGEKTNVSWKVIGKHQLLSALAAASMGIVAGLTLKQIGSGLSQVQTPLHRLNLVKTENYNILDDTYNSSPKAARESIETLIELGKNRQKIAILSEMKDLGKFSSLEHSNLGKYIASRRIDHLITIGKIASIISESAKRHNFKGKILNVSTVPQAAKQINKVASKNSLILIKGSRHIHLERIVFSLQGKPTQISCYHCGNLK